MTAKAKNSRELFHHWAHQVREDGRCGNVGYVGPVLFSYAEPIAVLLEGGRVLLSDRKFSVTTTSHQSAAARATSHLTRCYATVVPERLCDLDLAHTSNQQIWLRRAEQALAELSNHPRRKVSLAGKISGICQAMNAYSDFFKLGWSPATVEGLSVELAAEAEKAAAAAKEAEIARGRERERRIHEDHVLLLDWRAGADSFRRWEITALRLRGDEIQTTQGAGIPVEHAVAAWPLLKRIKESGKAYIRNGHTIHLGYYAVDSFDGEVLKVWCHEIPWSEVELMAKELGL